MAKALLSVSDKTDLEKIAHYLLDRGYELISTGGTGAYLQARNIPFTEISAFTGFPEILGGRVKTLHPQVHGSILYKRDDPVQQEEAKALALADIDVVVANLYPFAETIAEHPDNHALAIENIDIGGVTLLRAAAKNYAHVLILSEPGDYTALIAAPDLFEDEQWRRKLAGKAFMHTARYDSLIGKYLLTDTKLYDNNTLPDVMPLLLTRTRGLRYGENPHQSAALYRQNGDRPDWLSAFSQHQGKELSYNNLADSDAALALLAEFSEATAVAVKHKNPCAVASAGDICQAFTRAHDADPKSIFGGIVAVNRQIDSDTAEAMAQKFLEVIIAPGFTAAALACFEKKKNLRLLSIAPAHLEVNKSGNRAFTWQSLGTSVLMQQQDTAVHAAANLTCVTATSLRAPEIDELLFANRVVKHVRSNAVVLTRDFTTIGIGPGQTSRVWALEAALAHASQPVTGSYLASDAFFPFADAIEMAARAGVRGIIQPGGSRRDEEVLAAANELGLAMYFTGIRHFRH
jgi:phosphoribosylaminoimidazolecarboxamide formyltransferase/IMP cyclohydrolase